MFQNAAVIESPYFGPAASSERNQIWVFILKILNSLQNDFWHDHGTASLFSFGVSDLR